MKIVNYISVIILLLSQTYAKNNLYGSSVEKIVIDSALVNTYIDNAFNYAFYNPDSAFYYIDTAIIMANQIGYNKKIAEAYQVKGIIYYAIDKYDSALIFYHEALGIRVETGDLKGTAASFNNIAATYSSLSLYKLAVKNNLEALRIHEALSDAPRIGNSLNNLALNYHYLNEYETALKFYKEALEYKNKIPDNEKDIARTLSNIGQLYFDWGYSNEQYYDSAASYLFKAIKIRQKIEDIQGLSESLFNLGNIYIEKEQFDRALIFIDDAYNNFKLANDKSGIAKVYSNIGYIAYRRGNPDYKNALINFNKSVGIAKEVSNLQLLQDNYLHISNIFKFKGQYDNAYQYIELYNEVKDSIASIEIKKEIIRLQIEYEAKKREATIAKQQAQIRKLILKKNRLLIFTSILGLSILIMGVILIIVKRKSK